jgi:hypothetical protein
MPETQQENRMNISKRLVIKIGIVLCSTLLGSTTYGQPSVVVGVSVPVPTIEVVTPTVEISAVTDFYEPLAAEGDWVVVGSYGRCWRPARVEADWRPYSNGSWQNTDAGWYWVSDEPWAWATYHYGRWDFTDETGWYWVPQTQWAPAWVSWHEGGGYIGWAPLQPSVSISAGGLVGFDETRISPRAFVFVQEGQFLDPISPKTVAADNTAIIKKTTSLSNTKMVNNAVINGGPATASIEKATGRKVQAAVPVQNLRRQQEAAVASKPATPTATSEKKAPATVGSEVAPAEKKAVAAPESPPVAKPSIATPAEKAAVAAPESPRAEKPAAATPEPAKPSPKINEAPAENSKPVTANPESKPAAMSEDNQRPAAKEPTQPPAEKPAEQPRAPAAPPDNRGQPPASEKPAANDKGDPGPASKDQENKP